MPKGGSYLTGLMQSAGLYRALRGLVCLKGRREAAPEYSRFGLPGIICERLHAVTLKYSRQYRSKLWRP
jgi:hypothetical protein